jgi:hypothetical protein
MVTTGGLPFGFTLCRAGDADRTRLRAGVVQLLDLAAKRQEKLTELGRDERLLQAARTLRR